MTTLKDSIFSAIQDAPNLTAREYAQLLDVTSRMPSVSSTLCSLRDEGFITSAPGADGTLRYTAVKAKEVGTRKPPEKKATKPAIVITTKVVIEHDGVVYELPQPVVDAIRRMK